MAESNPAQNVSAPDAAAIRGQRQAPGSPGAPPVRARSGWRGTLKDTGKKFVRDRCSMARRADRGHGPLLAVAAAAALMEKGRRKKPRFPS